VGTGRTAVYVSAHVCRFGVVSVVSDCPSVPVLRRAVDPLLRLVADDVRRLFAGSRLAGRQQQQPGKDQSGPGARQEAAQRQDATQVQVQTLRTLPVLLQGSSDQVPLQHGS